MDFKRNKDGIPAKVERMSMTLTVLHTHAILCYVDEVTSLHYCSDVVFEAGAVLVSGSAAIKVGNTLPIRNIPVGTTIHCIEMKL